MKVGDLVRTRWETDVRKEDKWHDHKVHGRRHRIGIIFAIADRRTLKKNSIYWVKWNDEYLPSKSLMISTEIEIINKKE
jgi:hypothetical protein